MKILAIDSETDGLFLYHGCRAFMFTAFGSDGYKYIWEFDVDPYTRKVDYTSTKAKRVIRGMLKVIRSYGVWVFHNATFDLTTLSFVPFPKPFNFDEYILPHNGNVIIEDTMLMAHCSNSLMQRGLKALAFYYCDYPETDEKELDKIVTACRRVGKKLKYAIAEPEHEHLTPLKDSKGKCDFWLPATLFKHHPEKIPARIRAKCEKVCEVYAMGDVQRTLGLYFTFQGMLQRRECTKLKVLPNWISHHKVKQTDWECYKQNAESIVPTYLMQHQGIYLHRNKLPKMLYKLSQAKEDTRQKMQRISGVPDFNPRSNPELQTALYENLKLPPIAFSDAGNPKADKETLKEYLEQTDINKRQYGFIRHLLTYRQLNTSEGYLDSYKRYETNNAIHSFLGITGTDTLRYAHRNPNAGNVSKSKKDEDALDLTIDFKLRSAFGPRPGRLWFCIDYASLQLRIFAYAAKDKFLIESFEQGADPHNSVACKIFNTNNPTDLQRRTAKNINFGIIFGAGRSKIDRMSGFVGARDLFIEQFPNFRTYLSKCSKDVRHNGYVRTLGGYPLYVQKRKSYKGCNYVVQGTEGEIVKKAINECTYYCLEHKVPFKPIMMVHDEIIFETKKEITKQKFLANPENHKHLAHIRNLMNNAGAYFNVKTDVNCEISDDHWAKAVPYKFQPSLITV